MLDKQRFRTVERNPANQSAEGSPAVPELSERSGLRCIIGPDGEYILYTRRQVMIDPYVEGKVRIGLTTDPCPIDPHVGPSVDTSEAEHDALSLP
jgi:hypothetical protein